MSVCCCGLLQLVIVLKKEVIKTNNVTEHEDTDKYRQLLVRTLHSCSVRFPDMAANVIPVVSILSPPKCMSPPKAAIEVLTLKDYACLVKETRQDPVI